LINKPFGISFDFWNTLYGNGDEPKRHDLRVEYFNKIISNYIKVDQNSVEKAFRASTAFFIYEWQNNYRTPSAPERIQYMSKLLSVQLEKNDIDEISAYFGRLIFSVPPQNTSTNLNIVRQLARNYPLALISDTGYISGKFIREFLEKEGIISSFKSLVFSDEQKFCKPHPSVFQKTCKKLNTPCSQLIHIGDLEKTDIKGAKDSGCIGIRYTGWNNGPPENSQADHIINNYNDLFKTIENISNS
jgi:putative hydrolase of the HAD superfamily